MTSKTSLFGAAFSALLLSLPAIAAEDWFGQAPEADAAPVSVAEVLADRDDLIDQPLTVAGRMTDVCTRRGCWAVFEDNGEMLRIKVRDHNFAIPSDLRGQAVAHGILSKVDISPAYAQRMVDEYGADPIVLEQLYELQLIADGVRFVGDS
ncbi:MAG: DUF4920 domain-containing protein [Wenzhouxiangella sp.]|jgi:hypothetical protein|nr:DUF4920 domain-containing protein [Wenzhouxiangella sp.]